MPLIPLTSVPKTGQPGGAPQLGEPTKITSAEALEAPNESRRIRTMVRIVTLDMAICHLSEDVKICAFLVPNQLRNVIS